MEAEERRTEAAVREVGGHWERLIGDFEASMQASGLSLRTVEHYA